MHEWTNSTTYTHFRGTRHCRFRRKSCGEWPESQKRVVVIVRKLQRVVHGDYHGVVTFLTRRERTADGRGYDATIRGETQRRRIREVRAVSTRLVAPSWLARVGGGRTALSRSQVSLSLSYTHARARIHATYTTSTRALWAIRLLTCSLAKACRGNTRALARTALTNTINPLWGRIPGGAFRMYVRVREKQRQGVSEEDR